MGICSKTCAYVESNLNMMAHGDEWRGSEGETGEWSG